MNSCEQEMCPFWAGDAGCPCKIFGLSEQDRRDERRLIYPEGEL